VSEPLSIGVLIAEASFVVQLVMLLLLAISVISWWMIAQRFFFYRQTQKRMVQFEDDFWSGMDLAQLYRRSKDEDCVGVEMIFRAGFKEFSRLRQKKLPPKAIMDGSQRAMRVALIRQEEQLDLHLPFLATAGSTSPYIGLFGTVWGIMSSFRGLATVHQATLATVAPGISEALIATAMGLFAAIPAVIAYNRFNHRAERLMIRYETFMEEFHSILHRQAHEQV
jgi:biopolymer transport protein TolQ